MATTPRVSIIIPTYKRAHLVPDAIRSALAQTGSECEVIVVDDGSPDDTASVVGAFGDVVTYIRKENGGIESAINLGAEHMRGDYIYVLGDDDMMEPHAVEVLLTLLEAHPEAGLAYGRARVLNPEGEVVLVHDAPVGRPSGVWPGVTELRTLLLSNYICGGAMLLRKRLWDELHGFDPACNSIYEDWDLWVRTACVSAIGYVPELALNVRQTPGSLLMQIDNERRLRTFTNIVNNRRRMLDNVARHPDVKAQLADLWPRLEAMWLVDVAQLSFEKGEPAQGRAALRQAQETYPPIMDDELLPTVRDLQRKLLVPGPIATGLRAMKHRLGR